MPDCQRAPRRRLAHFGVSTFRAAVPCVGKPGRHGCLELPEKAEGLETLTFGQDFDESVDGLALPSCLQTLTFGPEFDQSLSGTWASLGLLR